MRLRTRLFIIGWLYFLMVACATNVKSAALPTPSPGTPDPDVITLTTQGEQAKQIAQKEAPEVTLRQVDTDLNKTIFRFTDNAATKEINIIVPEPESPSEQWMLKFSDSTPLTGHAGPGLNLQHLRIGSQRVAQAMATHWPGCTLRSLTLYPEGNHLTWVAFCNTPEGVVSGSMDNETEIFQPSTAPPALPPPTAEPFP